MALAKEVRKKNHSVKPNNDLTFVVFVGLTNCSCLEKDTWEKSWRETAADLDWQAEQHFFLTGDVLESSALFSESPVDTAVHKSSTVNTMRLCLL